MSCVFVIQSVRAPSPGAKRVRLGDAKRFRNLKILEMSFGINMTSTKISDYAPRATAAAAVNHGDCKLQRYPSSVRPQSLSRGKLGTCVVQTFPK
jgi:hypothetical protein